MEMKPGYKRTAVGVIPDDWNAEPLPKVVWFQEGPGLRNWQFRSTGLKVINVTNLQDNGYLDLSVTDRHISWTEFERTYQHFLIEVSDVVVASSGNSYGKTAVVREQDLPLLMNTSVIRFQAREGITRSFMLIFLKSRYFKKQIDLMITGGAQPNFGPAHLRKVYIPLPPTKAEQEAIAEALTNADGLIESLEQLLAKKRHIKRGAMQVLLTGMKRLPGFTRDWRTIFLNDCGEVIMGQSPPSASYNRSAIGSALINGPTEFTDRYPVRIQWTTQPARFCRTGDLLICVRGSSTGRTNYADDTYAIGRGVAAIRARDPNCTEYLSYQVISGVAEILAAATGSTFPSVDGASFRKLAIPLPPPDEQRAIASMLADISAEISSIEDKLAKTRTIKQGMMHDLLTGRIRLT